LIAGIPEPTTLSAGKKAVQERGGDENSLGKKGQEEHGGLPSSNQIPCMRTGLLRLTKTDRFQDDLLNSSTKPCRKI
jgi:hypothetical protein